MRRTQHIFFAAHNVKIEQIVSRFYIQKLCQHCKFASWKKIWVQNKTTQYWKIFPYCVEQFSYILIDNGLNRCFCPYPLAFFNFIQRCHYSMIPYFTDECPECSRIGNQFSSGNPNTQAISADTAILWVPRQQNPLCRKIIFRLLIMEMNNRIIIARISFLKNFLFSSYPWL